MDDEYRGPHAELIDKLRDWGAASNFLAREAFRVAETLDSRDREAARKARYRAGQRHTQNGPALEREDRLTG